MDGRGECCEESWRKSSGIEANRRREACVEQGGRGFDCRGRVEAKRRLSGSERVWRGPETKCDRRVQASTLRTYRTVFWLSLVAANETGEQEVRRTRSCPRRGNNRLPRTPPETAADTAADTSGSLTAGEVQSSHKRNIVSIHMYQYNGDVGEVVVMMMMMMMMMMIAGRPLSACHIPPDRTGLSPLRPPLAGCARTQQERRCEPLQIGAPRCFPLAGSLSTRRGIP